MLFIAAVVLFLFCSVLAFMKNEETRGFSIAVALLTCAYLFFQFASFLRSIFFAEWPPEVTYATAAIPFALFWGTLVRESFKEWRSSRYVEQEMACPHCGV